MESMRKGVRKLLSLIRSKQLSEQERELLRFQMQEIDQANVSLEEEERLEKKRRQLQNAEKLFQELTLSARSFTNRKDLCMSG